MVASSSAFCVAARRLLSLNRLTKDGSTAVFVAGVTKLSVLLPSPAAAPCALALCASLVPLHLMVHLGVDTLFPLSLAVSLIVIVSRQVLLAPLLAFVIEGGVAKFVLLGLSLMLAGLLVLPAARSASKTVAW